MSRLRCLSFLLACGFCLLGALGAEFKLITGDVYRGELSVADDEGVVVRLETGEFSPRIDWAKLSDDTLRILADNPKARRFAEPLIEPSVDLLQKPAPPITIRPVASRVPLIETKKGLWVALTSPTGLMLLLALFFANLYAAFEVARFKWRPVGLVCALSAALPVMGWVIFLVLPRRTAPEEENATETAVAQTSITAPSSVTDTPKSGGAAALGLSKSSAGDNEGLPKVFRRGETTFNRRFFETQFPSFFRVVTTEADRDLVLDVAAGKGSVVASRISRISANEAHFKTATGQEVGVAFSEISQVTLRHKDAA
ncbi:MAG: hypothetical protein RLZ45_1454 [Verrucomicrobiota bacterium]|jgi:hypothetical protein